MRKKQVLVFNLEKIFIKKVENKFVFYKITLQICLWITSKKVSE